VRTDFFYPNFWMLSRYASGVDEVGEWIHLSCNSMVWTVCWLQSRHLRHSPRLLYHTRATRAPKRVHTVVVPIELCMALEVDRRKSSHATGSCGSCPRFCPTCFHHPRAAANLPSVGQAFERTRHCTAYARHETRRDTPNDSRFGGARRQ
jgi:hypothetical protein